MSAQKSNQESSHESNQKSSHGSSQNQRKTSSENSGVSVTLSELIELRFQAKRDKRHRRSVVKTDQHGGYQSHFRGKGMDFDEVRAYYPGDDIRSMDWRVLARTGEPHTKVFKEERERPVFIFVDLNPSMFFGTKVCFKSVLAAKQAALQAWTAQANGDRVGGVVICGEHLFEFRPKLRTQGILPFLKRLADESVKGLENQTQSNLAKGFERLFHVVKPGSEIIILSDFSALDEEAKKPLKLLARRNEITLQHVYDPIEKEPPAANVYAISNGDKQVLLNTRISKVQQQYRAFFAEHEAALRQFAKQYGMRYQQVSG